MNALETLKEIYAHVKNTDHWVSDPALQNETALAGNADVLIRYAETLKEARDQRITALKADGPRVFEACGDLTVVLLRENAERYVTLTECGVRVVRTDDADYAESLGVKGPKHDDGYIYMLVAEPMDYGRHTRGVWLSFEEATVIKRRLREMREADDS